MATHQRNPYTGTEKTLVIGIDVGTTLSSVSYTLLEPGKVPRIHPVTHRSRDRPRNKPYAVLSEIEGVRRAEWFKLRLRPPHLAADKRAQLEKNWSPTEPEEDELIELLEIEGIGADIAEHELNNKRIPRPATDDFKTVVEVLADFLQYLFQCAKEYIIKRERYIDPTFVWSSVERNTYFVLTHPNGWEGKQLSQMHEAAVAAGLVYRSTAADRISFVTECEANLHFCLDKSPELYQECGGLLVVNCGDVTINLSAYLETKKGVFKEVASPDCLLDGSIFVTSRARDYFRGRFKDSHYGTDDDIEAMVRAFDRPEGAKCMFRGPANPYFVKFGDLRDSDRKYGITTGKFKIDGAQMAELFDPTVQDIIDGIRRQCGRSVNDGVPIKYILLVGVFARIDYLYTKLRDYFKSNGIVVLRPDNVRLDNTVAEGAVSWYLDRYVSIRIARFTYGVITRHLFNDKDPDHLNRESTKLTLPNGKSYISGIFTPILERGSEVSEETQFRQPHMLIFTRGQFAAWTTVSIRLKCYRGKAADPPKWVDREPNSFHDACTIQADMSHIKPNMKLYKVGTKLFYILDFEVVILLGFTELKAYITWKENGIEKRADASIFYD